MKHVYEFPFFKCAFSTGLKCRAMSVEQQKADQFVLLFKLFCSSVPICPTALCIGRSPLVSFFSARDGPVVRPVWKLHALDKRTVCCQWITGLSVEFIAALICHGEIIKLKLGPFTRFNVDKYSPVLPFRLPLFIRSAPYFAVTSVPFAALCKFCGVLLVCNACWLADSHCTGRSLSANELWYSSGGRDKTTKVSSPASQCRAISTPVGWCSVSLQASQQV